MPKMIKSPKPEALFLEILLIRWIHVKTALNVIKASKLVQMKRKSFNFKN